MRAEIQCLFVRFLVSLGIMQHIVKCSKISYDAALIPLNDKIRKNIVSYLI